MDKGWIKIYRKIRESPIYQEGLFFVFAECLLEATHKEIKIDYAGNETILLPGQFVFGRHKWAKRLHINESTLYKRILKLIRFGIILEQNSNSRGGTIYQIQKWSEYQQEEQPSNSQVTAKEQLSNTNKNVRTEECKNNTKEIYKEKKPNEGEMQKIADDFQVPLSFVVSKWDDLETWCAAKGKSYKDYRAALRNWVKKDAISIKKEAHDKRPSLVWGSDGKI